MARVAGTMVFPFPSAQNGMAPGDARRNALNNFLKKMKKFVLIFRNAEEEVCARKIYDELNAYLEKNSHSFRNNSKNKRTPQIFAAETNREFIRIYSELGHKHGVDADEIHLRCIEFKRKRYDGAFLPFANTIIINLSAVSQRSDSKPVVEAFKKLTELHEFFHSIGGFGQIARSKDFELRDMEWIDDGCTQLFAIETMKKLYPQEFKIIPESLINQYYPEYITAVRELMKVLGKTTVIDAYFAGNFGIIAKKIDELGVNAQFEAILMRLKVKRKRISDMDLSEAGQADGFSTDAIRALRQFVPNGQTDIVPKMALAANLHYAWNLNRNPTFPEVVGFVKDELQKMSNIPAYAYQGMIAKATESFESSFKTTEIYGELGPSSISADIAQDISTMWARLDLRAGSGIDTKTRTFGGGIDTRTSTLIESAVTSLMLVNDGQIPDVAQVAATIYENYVKSSSIAGVEANAEMVASQIVSDMLNTVQNGKLEGNNWVLNAALDFITENAINGDITSLLNTPYDQKVAPILSAEIESIAEFNGYGDVLVDKSVQLFNDAGVQPTCGELYGFLVSTAQIANEIPKTGINEFMDIIPGHSSLVVETISLIDSFSAQIAQESISNLVSMGQTDRLTAIQDMAGRSGTQPNWNVCAAKELFATLLEIRYPSDAVMLNENAEIIVVTPNGKIRTPKTNSNAVASQLMGATAETADPRKIFKSVNARHEALKSSLQGKLGVSEYSAKLLIAGINDPFDITQEIGEFAKYIEGISDDPLVRAKRLYELVRSDGELLISGGLYYSDRQGGSKAPAEVLRDRTANCLELASLYILVGELAFKNDKNARLIALDVVNTEHRVEIGHACAGVLLESDEVIGHPKFNHDWKFRSELLKELGITDSPKLKLLVVDPVNSVFDYRFENIVYLDKRKLTSFFYSNSARYLEGCNKSDEAEKCIEIAEKLWDGNPAVVAARAYSKKKTDPNAAVAILDSMDPAYKTSDIYSSAGLIRFNNDDWASAENYFNEALKLNANNETALYSIAFIIKQKKEIERFDIAKKHLERLISVTRNSRKRAVCNEGMSRATGRKIDLELETKNITNKQAALAHYYADLAEIYIDQKDFKTAANLCAKGLRANRSDPRLGILKQISVTHQPITKEDKGFTISVDPHTGILDFSPIKKANASFSGSGFKISKIRGSDKKLTKAQIETVLEKANLDAKRFQEIEDSSLNPDEKRVLRGLMVRSHHAPAMEDCAKFEIMEFENRREFQRSEIVKRAAKFKELFETEPLKINRLLLRKLADAAKQCELAEDEMRNVAMGIMQSQLKNPANEDITPYFTMVKSFLNRYSYPFGKLRGLNLFEDVI